MIYTYIYTYIHKIHRNIHKPGAPNTQQPHAHSCPQQQLAYHVSYPFPEFWSGTACGKGVRPCRNGRLPNPCQLLQIADTPVYIYMYYKYIYIYKYTNMYKYTHICMYIYVYVYVHTYIHM